MPDTSFADLRQSWPMPSHRRPITIIGCGGIVRDGHLRAYRKMGLPVAGVFDVDGAAARQLARDFDVPVVHASLDDAIAACSTEGVFDLALPPAAVLEAVKRLPKGATALIQKPLGPDGAAAREIVATLDERAIVAATNFQLRFTPSMLAIEDAVRRGLFGEIVDVDIHLAVYMPWELWSFIPKMPAVEIPLHSIHYLDWIRGLLGEPDSVYAKSVKHPRYADQADARSSIILDYGERVRCALSLNHTYGHGPRHTEATIRVEGVRGAAHLRVGYLLDYLHPQPERLEICHEGRAWAEVPLEGERVPDSFAYVMANLQRFVAGEDEGLITNVGDSLRTMLLVDAALKSSRLGGVVPEPPLASDATRP
jgi:predicted dehydrogenase